MEIDLASINNELSKTIKNGERAAAKADDATLPPGSRLKTIEELAKPAIAQENAAKELAELKERHAEEINNWKEYERRIQVWKQQVQDIFQNLKSEVAKKQEIAAELIKAKAELKTKEKELGTLRFYIENKEGKEVLDKLSEI